MILVDSLGDDFPTFPMFRRMLREYERELAARPPPTPAPRRRPPLAIPARTSMSAVESPHRHEFHFDGIDNVFVCWCGATHTMAEVLDAQGPR